MKVASISLLLLSTATSFALAGEPAERPHGPPPAAFEACAGKSAGDSCSVTFRDRKIDGTCKVPPQDDRLICWPDHPPPGPPPDRSNQ